MVCIQIGSFFLWHDNTAKRLLITAYASKAAGACLGGGLQENAQIAEHQHRFSPTTPAAGGAKPSQPRASRRRKLQLCNRLEMHHIRPVGQAQCASSCPHVSERRDIAHARRAVHL